MTLWYVLWYSYINTDSALSGFYLPSIIAYVLFTMHCRCCNIIWVWSIPPWPVWLQNGFRNGFSVASEWPCHLTSSPLGFYGVGDLVVMGLWCLSPKKSNNAVMSQNFIVLFVWTTTKTISRIKYFIIYNIFGVFLETNTKISCDLGTVFFKTLQLIKSGALRNHKGIMTAMGIY